MVTNVTNSNYSSSTYFCPPPARPLLRPLCVSPALNRLKVPPAFLIASLLNAVRADNIVEVRRLVVIGVSPNQADATGATPLVLAVRRGCADMVRELKKLGANIHGLSETGCTLATVAVIAHQPQMLSLLQELGCNLEAYNRVGTTAGGVAVVTNKLAMVRELFRLGYNFNLPDGKGANPLHYCWQKDLKEMARLLVKECNVSINSYSTYDKVFLYGKNKVRPQEGWETLFRELDVDLGLHEEWLMRKALAHVWGISGTSTLVGKNKDERFTFPLTRWSQHFTIGLLQRSFCHFLAHHTTAFTAADKIILREIVDNLLSVDDPTPPSTVVATMQRRPVLFLGGTFGHVVAFLSTPSHIFLCNRGAGYDGEGVSCYLYKQESLTPEKITQLRTRQASMALLMGHLTPQAGLTRTLGIAMKAQKAPTCAWTSLKTAVQALFSLYHKAEQYKYFSVFTRQFFLHFYLEKSKNYDLQLLLKIDLKLKQKITAGKLLYPSHT